MGERITASLFFAGAVAMWVAGFSHPWIHAVLALITAFAIGFLPLLMVIETDEIEENDSAKICPLCEREKK